jgi:hypothetical protein
MKGKKLISICVSIFLVFFIFTSCTFLPKLELTRKVNVMDIIRIFAFPARTLVYLNKIFTNERKEIPVSSGSENSEKNNKIFKILLISMMSAILIPASIRLVKPGFMPYPTLSILNGRRNKAAPPLLLGFNRYSSCRVIFGRQNNRRERRSASCSALIFKTDKADDSESESQLNNKSSHTRKYIQQITSFNPQIKYGFKCLIIYSSIITGSLVLFKRRLI